jgi:hypothetical protein
MLNERWFEQGEIVGSGTGWVAFTTSPITRWFVSGPAHQELR